jgi:hexokinase
MAHSTKRVEQDSSWRQRSELEAMADLPPELERELQRLDKEFWVSTKKLKQIVKVFHEELDEGTQAPTKNKLQRTKGR